MQRMHQVCTVWQMAGPTEKGLSFLLCPYPNLVEVWGGSNAPIRAYSGAIHLVHDGARQKLARYGCSIVGDWSHGSISGLYQGFNRVKIEFLGIRVRYPRSALWRSRRL